MSITSPRIAILFVVSLSLLNAAGCGGSSGPDLVPVTGTVTLDGTPLKNAQVRFEPSDTAAGRSSQGTTDDQGHYELRYTVDKMGAVQGTHTVTFSVPDQNEAETLPEKFNTKSTYTAEVTDGGAPIDFTLTK